MDVKQFYIHRFSREEDLLISDVNLTKKMNVKKVLIISTNICHCPPLGSSEIFLAYIFGNLLNASDLSQKVTWDRISHLTVTAWTHTYKCVSKLRWINHLILKKWKIFIRIYTYTIDMLCSFQTSSLWYHPGSCKLISKNWHLLLETLVNVVSILGWAHDICILYETKNLCDEKHCIHCHFHRNTRIETPH